MQIRLSFKTDNGKPLSLPLGHHSALQGLIYRLLKSSPEYADFIHDTGYTDGAHSFKMFVFSTLKGRHSIVGKNIVFSETMHLEVRSPATDFCNAFLSAIQKADNAELFHQKITIDECNFTKNKIGFEKCRISLLSPITLSTTFYENEKKKTRFLTPEDPDFNAAFIHNAKSKYRAYFNEELPGETGIVPVSVTERDKYVTKFNDRIYITAWSGTYELTGRPEVLTFLYDAGIGGRNSQGFGMFEPE